MGRWRTHLAAGVLALLASAGVQAQTAQPTQPAQAALLPPTAGQMAAFFRAVALDDADTVRRMVGSSVNANQPNPVGGEPALVLAVREKSRRVVDVLLAHKGTDLEVRAPNGNTALMMAAWQDDFTTVQKLIQHGARVNQDGWTALHYAAASGAAAVAQQLLAHGARIDARAPAVAGSYTPLMLAARERKAALVRLLLASGADPAARDGEGLTAAQIAERAGHTEIVKLLPSGK